MPNYEYGCQDCQYEWEDFYHASEEKPVCPKCGGETKRLISMTHARVEVTGRELKQKIKDDAVKMTRSMYQNETKLANFIGEDKYQKNETIRDEIKKG